MSRKNDTEYQRDWQDIEAKIRMVRLEVTAVASTYPDKLHRSMHRIIIITLRKAELYCELMRAKELLWKGENEQSN